MFWFFDFLQELKEKQKEFESKAMLFSRLGGEKSSAKQEPAFKNNIAPLQRKQLTASKPNKQQAVVQPLQGQYVTATERIYTNASHLLYILNSSCRNKLGLQLKMIIYKSAAYFHD